MAGRPDAEHVEVLWPVGAAETEDATAMPEAPAAEASTMIAWTAMRTVLMLLTSPAGNLDAPCCAVHLTPSASGQSCICDAATRRGGAIDQSVCKSRPMSSTRAEWVSSPTAM